ncbi:acyl carrier protein [Clostridium sp.]|uniref:acyl carrier protein n=1 Tax=Clostridium sp. TaxID=1506 RepID=UPI003F3175F3
MIKEKLIEMLTCINEEYSKKLIVEDCSLKDLGVDSLEFIRLIVMIEDEFKIELPDEYLDIDKIHKLESIIKLIKKELVVNNNAD